MKILKAGEVLENNFDISFDYTFTAMLIIDNNRVIKRINQAFSEILGLEASEVTERRLGEGMRCINSFEKGCGDR